MMCAMGLMIPKILRRDSVPQPCNRICPGRGPVQLVLVTASNAVLLLFAMLSSQDQTRFLAVCVATEALLICSQGHLK